MVVVLSLLSGTPRHPLSLRFVSQVMSFIHPKNSVALQNAQSSCHFSMMREIHDITPSTYEHILHRLEYKLFEYHPKVRYVILPRNNLMIYVNSSHSVSTTSATTPGRSSPSPAARTKQWLTARKATSENPSRPRLLLARVGREYRLHLIHGLC